MKFYILHTPTNSRYDELVGFQPFSQTDYKTIENAKSKIEELLEKHTNMSSNNLHVCVL